MTVWRGSGGVARKRTQPRPSQNKQDASPYHDVANEKPWDAAQWCPELHFLARTIFAELQVDLERRALMLNAVDKAGFRLVDPNGLRGGAGLRISTC